jgi:hypothetical protein
MAIKSGGSRKHDAVGSHRQADLPACGVHRGCVWGRCGALSSTLRDRPLTAALSFLLVVLIVSAAWGFRYALFVPLLATLGFRWLLPRAGRFWLNDPRDVFMLAAFLVIRLTTSHLSDSARGEALNANHRRAQAVAAKQRFRDLVNSVEAIVWEVSFSPSSANRGNASSATRRNNGWLNRHSGGPLSRRGIETGRCNPAYRPQPRNAVMILSTVWIAADRRVLCLRDLVTLVLENGRATQLRGDDAGQPRRREP